MPSGGTWLRKALTLLTLGVGGVSAVSATPDTRLWSPDPEEQFLLDVNLRQLRLSEGVRAYQTPEGTCVLFGDFLAALDVPLKIDMAAKKASGWAFRESHRVDVDLAGGSASFGGKREAIRPETVRETGDGWCVDTAALGRWFGITVKPVTAGSVLVIESDAKLPIELAMERQTRAASLKTAKFDINSLPQVRLPYRMWRAPALDFVVSGGITYRAKDGARIDRRTSVYAAGEIAKLSYDAQFSTTDKGVPSAFRFRAYRSDPDGGLLGPLKATHFGFGDVAGFDSRLTGSAASGRGAVVTNRPVRSLSSFDRTRFEGDLPAGWEAEIYRNGELLGFARPDGSQRYVFDNVPLMYGENQIRIVLYGPQGQTRTKEELINVGQDNVPSGKTWYWAGFSQPGRDLLSFRKPPDDVGQQPEAQAAIAVEHGLDERTSVGLLARAMLIHDEKLTFLEGSVRRSIGPALVELSGAYDGKGGTAARVQALARIGSVNATVEALLANDFHLRGDRPQTMREARVAIDAPIRIGRTVLPAHVGVHYTDRQDGSKQLEAAARLSASIERFNLATDIRYRRQYLRSGPSPPSELEWSLLGSGRVGDVRLRGQSTFDLAPERRFRSAELSAYWSASDKVDWEAALAYDGPNNRGRARLTHIRRLSSMALAVTGEAATDGSLAIGFNLNFSLDPGSGFRLSRQPLASAGSVQARVYRDLNDNGVRDHAEPYEKGALVTTGTRLAEKLTDANGSVMVAGLAAFTPVTVGIDESSLSDPMLVPKKALQVVIPRPGVPAEVEIGLVGGGDIEGALVKSGGIGFEGLAVELLDANGKVVATAQSDFDGFFLFERVPYGTYRLRLTAESAGIAKLIADLNVAASVSADRSVARLGAIHVEPLPQLASSR
ncbi:MAG TPA: carboxypeptidase-like regulatory domain-containing protein [Sphingomicrobium sp.]|nr:carboxypeptidase-like regulatory domain-containing protein [Sphingomicrobium sp.]